ncbi:hypothetical protein [Microcoleus sp. FACHB-672]|uniref:hypothetical protein n=1 Tax=Microcoleus sp. FACHB-672 TaxID=2692825 RepID=UPI00168867DD|nr:hypothetical protein [Microcoleus sp. FACHB-672]
MCTPVPTAQIFADCPQVLIFKSENLTENQDAPAPASKLWQRGTGNNGDNI